MQQTFTSMMHILFLLFSLTFIFSLSLTSFGWQRTPFTNSIIGVVFGMFGVVNIALASELTPGILVDLRNPVVIVAGIFGGGIGAFASAGIIALYRVVGVGGAGALGGSATILTVAAMTTYAHHRIPSPRPIHWLSLGLLSVGISVAWSSATLPADISALFLEQFIPVALIFYPLLTLALGLLITREVDKMQLREEVARNAYRFEAIFNQSYQFMGLLTPEGRLVESNKTALEFADLTEEDVIGKYFWESYWWTISPETQARLRDAIQRAAQGETVQYRVDVLGKNAQVFTIDFSIKPIRDESGKVIMLVPEGRDITKEIIAEQQRFSLAVEKERNLMLKNFIADSSHHLRTPVTILKTSQYLVQRYIKNMRETADNINWALAANTPDAIHAHTAQLTTTLDSCEKRVNNFDESLNALTILIEDLLSLVRLDKDDDIHPQPLELVGWLREQLAGYEDVLSAAQRTFHLNLPDSKVMIDADSDHLQRMFENLVENAIRYTSPGGTISLDCHVATDTVSITMTDDGIGISEADCEQIFERFYRADNARQHNSKGTGLGLAIVHKTITRHNGSITVDSTVGAGTTFTIRLPLQDETAAATINDSRNRAGTAAG